MHTIDFRSNLWSATAIAAPETSQYFQNYEDLLAYCMKRFKRWS